MVTFKLFQNYPNPFHTSTIIQFFVPKRQKIGYVIYDVLGREIEKWSDECDSGLHTKLFTAPVSGAYFLQLQTSLGTETMKMIAIK